MKFNPTPLSALFCAVVLAAAPARPGGSAAGADGASPPVGPAPAVLLYDCGTEQSAVWPGFTRITPGSLAEAGPDGAVRGPGWRSGAGLAARVRAYREPVANPARGTTEPPPIWTNALTEDAILGSAPNTFHLPKVPGIAEIALLCGSSDPAHHAQFFDFTVRVGAQERRVQIEGCHQFRLVRLRVGNERGPLSIVITPRSKWIVNAILAWGDADDARVRSDVLRPIEDATFRMPDAEWARWEREPEPPTGPEPALHPEEGRRGFRLWSRNPFSPVYPGTQPLPEELEPVLRVFTTPGECAVATFVVTPLRPLAEARVTVEALGPVPASAVEVRRVLYTRARPNYASLHRYRIVPDVLARTDGEAAGSDLPARENTRYWLTIRVPESTPAGAYEGRVRFCWSGGEAALPLHLRVLPIRLREDPGRLYAIYYQHPYDLLAAAPDDVSREHFRRKADLEHADMVAHGTRNVVLSCRARAADARGDFGFDWELLAAKLELWRRHSFVGPVVMGIPAESIYEKHAGARYGTHLRIVKDPPPGFDGEITTLVRAIEEQRRRRGWPEFLYYPVDEPSTEPAAVRFMERVLRACKEAGVRTYVTADPTHEAFAPLRPLVDVWCTQPFAPDRATVLADSAARGVEYWSYPNHISGENDHTPAVGARMTYGFGFWHSGFRALVPWIYQSRRGDPDNYLDGPAMDFLNHCEPDGTPKPVILWEAYREGWTDHRYIATLEQLVAEAGRGGGADARREAEEAAAELDGIRRAIRVQPKYKVDGLWTADSFDVRRWLIARRILRLQEALRR